MEETSNKEGAMIIYNMRDKEELVEIIRDLNNLLPWYKIKYKRDLYNILATINNLHDCTKNIDYLQERIQSKLYRELYNMNNISFKAYDCYDKCKCIQYTFNIFDYDRERYIFKILYEYFIILAGELQ